VQLKTLFYFGDIFIISNIFYVLHKTCFEETETVGHVTDDLLHLKLASATSKMLCPLRDSGWAQVATRDVSKLRFRSHSGNQAS